MSLYYYGRKSTKNYESSKGRRWVKMYNAPLMMVEQEISITCIFRIFLFLHGGFWKSKMITMRLGQEKIVECTSGFRVPVYRRIYPALR